MLDSLFRLTDQVPVTIVQAWEATKFMCAFNFLGFHSLQIAETIHNRGNAFPMEASTMNTDKK